MAASQGKQRKHEARRKQAFAAAAAYRLATAHSALVHALDFPEGGQVRVAHALLQGPVLLSSVRCGIWLLLLLLGRLLLLLWHKLRLAWHLLRTEDMRRLGSGLEHSPLRHMHLLLPAMHWQLLLLHDHLIWPLQRKTAKSDV